MDELKTKIDLEITTEQKITDEKIGNDELWMVKDQKGQTFGPFETSALKEYSHKYQYLFEQCQAYNLLEEVWKDFFSLPQFQRRKPQLVSSQNLIKEQNFYIKVQGEKKGPFNQEQVQRLLDRGEIKPSTEISLDLGSCWIKLYEHHAFDRRVKKSSIDHLPYKPDSAVLKKSKELAEDVQSDDSLITLAYLEHLKDEKNSARTFKVQFSKGHQFEEELTQSEDYNYDEKKLIASNEYSRLPIYALASILLIGVFYFGNMFFDNNAKKTLPGETSAPITKSIDNSDRSVQQKRRPASIKKERPQRARAKTRTLPTRTKTSAAKEEDQYDSTQEYDEISLDQDNVERFDINDPEVQEELTRQLAGEYELDGEPAEDEEYINEEIMDEQNLDESYPEELDYPEEEIDPEYDTEERIIHSDEDY